MEREFIALGKKNTALIRGEETVDDWTYEELLAGRQRNKNGGWSGRPPKVVPKVVHDELVRRTIEEGGDLLRGYLVDAIKELNVIIHNKETPSGVKLRAIETVMDRVMGKAPDKVEIKGDSPWVLALTTAIVADDEQPPDEDIQDAEVVDDTDNDAD